MLRRLETYGFHPSTTPEQIDELARVLRRTGWFIPEVLDSAVGRNRSDAGVDLVWEHAYESPDAYARYMIRDRLEPGDTFIDIGANIGMHTLVASQCVGDQGCVVAIEPYWPSAQALRRNVSMSANDNVRIVEVAVGDRAERRVMDSFAGNIGMNPFADRRVTEYLRVPVSELR